MGCTPSHTDVIHSLTKSGIQLFKKPRGILPGPCGDSERDSIPLLVQNSTCYDSGGGLYRRQTWMGEPLDSKTMQNTAEGLGWLSRDLTAIQRKDLEVLIPESKTSLSRLNKSQSSVALGNPFKTQSSRGTVAPGQDFEGRKSQETSTRNPKGPGHGSSTWTHDCQTILPAPRPQGQVDFPESLVKAHRHAYSYLNSSLSRYEAILDLTHRASQTQELLQPMVSFLLRCFEEVNRLLGEICGEGDVLLRDTERVLAWPGEKGRPGEQPHLLQQLLQHTVSKLQALQLAAASLTSGLALSARGCLHAAASHLGEKLSTKRGVEEHLLRTLGQLEDLASGHRDPSRQGLPLCSEDSGIGVDAELGPAGDKLGQQGSCDSVPEAAAPESVASPQVGPGASGSAQLPCLFQDCPFSRTQGAKVQPTSEETGDPKDASSVPEMGSPQLLGLHPGTCWDSPGPVTSAPASLPTGSLWRDSPSLGEGSDSSPEEVGDEESGVCPGTRRKNVSRPRPRSSPVSSVSLWQTQPRRLRGHQAQEMVLKMQEAISERIKFVPAPSAHPDWAEEEEEEEERTTAESLQPSTRSGSLGNPAQHRRPQSEPCIRTHARDSTLRQLPRVQRDLSLRLDVFHTLGTGWQDQIQEWGLQQPRAVAQRPAGCTASPSSALSKMKASLTKSASILPSQDRSTLRQHSARAEGAQPWGGRAGGLPPGTSPGAKAREVPGAKEETAAAPLPRTSVKKLIETFSRPERPPDSGPLPRRRKWGVPSLPPRFPIYRGLAPLYPKPQISPAGREFPRAGPGRGSCMPVLPPLLASPSPSGNLSVETVEDPELLPPPPLEILMDTSFASLGPPDSSELAGRSPEGVPVAGLGGAGPARSTGASRSPSILQSSRGAAAPSKPRGAGLGSGRSSCRARKLPAAGLHLPPAARQTPGPEPSRAQRQARADKAAGAWKQAKWAVPWHPSSRPAAPTGVPHLPASPSPPLCPLASPRVLSPPREEKRVSPPPQHGLPSPPPVSPGSSSQSNEASPPSSGPSPSPSPPASAAQGHKELHQSSGPGDGPGASELKGSGRAASAPELCVLGRGLHRAQAQPEAPPRPKEGA
ncbi:photoreceptor cilium actin regulator [Sorex araneus]|uniref:photoreceptor cilium actin regulator n=1 Tax=Sorex araneus TaxID=42254 RepID=UPI0024335C35|nr:photoreceptor cilium actin regulator [Sorex araneus]